MIRRLLATLDRDQVVAILVALGVVFAYGQVQQAEEAATLRAGAQQQASK